MKVSTFQSRLILFTVVIIAVVLGWQLLSAPSNISTLDESTAHYAGPFKVYVQLDPEQPKVGNNSLTIILYDKDNQPVTDAQIKAVAEMPAMGSMSAMPAPSTMEHSGAGIYEGVFKLAMKGAWPLTLEINSNKTGNARLEFDLTTSRTGVRLSSATASKISRLASKRISDLENKVIVANQYRLQVQVAPNPPIAGKNKLTIIVKDKKAQLVTGAKVHAVAQMSAMGNMEAKNASVNIVETSAGIYSGEFTPGMRAEWSLAIKVESKALGHGDLVIGVVTGRKGLEFTTATQGAQCSCSEQTSDKSTISDVCPICAKDLVSVTKKERQFGSISMDARRRQLIGVTTSFAEVKNLTQTIRAAGRITYDETRLMDITLKFNGWIGKLKADFVGIPVKAGQSLFSVYSPELLSAQQEYLETFRRRKNKKDSLLKAARQRLLLWDVTSSQIQKLEKRGSPVEYLPIISPVNGIVIEKNIVAGSAVKAGMRLLRIADLSTVWVEGQIYEYEIPLVKVGMNAKIVLPEQPGKILYGKVAYIYPYLAGDTRTAKVRVELDNRDGLLKPDMYAHVHLKVNLGKRLIVPEAAVIYAGESRIVFIDLGNGQLQPRSIKTGLRNADDIEVLEGLKPGDKVVTSGNFLIAAESKLKAAIDQW